MAGYQEGHSGELKGWTRLRQQSWRVCTESHTCQVSLQTHQFEISLGQTDFLILEGIQRRQKVIGTPSVQFSLSVVSDSVTPRIAARQTSLSITNSQSSPKLMSIESVMPSSHLILCHIR